jgi:hypothetical protein
MWAQRGAGSAARRRTLNPPQSGAPRADFTARWRRWSVAPKRRSSGAQPPYSFRDCLKSLLRSNAALSKDDRAILRRWLGDFRANEVWGAIFAHAVKKDGSGPSMNDASSFIDVILLLKCASERENELIPRLVELQTHRKELLADLRKKIAGKITSLPENQLVLFLERVLDIFRNLVPMVTSQPRVRSSDSEGSRARTLFMQDLSRWVHDDTGKFLDEQVGIITEIVFDTPDIISADAVRSARRQKSRKQKKS